MGLSFFSFFTTCSVLMDLLPPVGVGGSPGAPDRLLSHMDLSNWVGLSRDHGRRSQKPEEVEMEKVGRFDHQKTNNTVNTRHTWTTTYTHTYTAICLDFYAWNPSVSGLS